MPFQFSVFKTRSLSALLFVAVMGFGLFVSAWTYTLLFLFLLAMSWSEFTNLTDRIYSHQTHPYVTLGWILNGWAICLLFSREDLLLGGYSLRESLWLPFHLAGFILLIAGTFLSKKVSIRHWLANAAGSIYLTLPFALALHLYGFCSSPDAGKTFFSPAVWWVVVVVITMWINDTMAYVVGSLIGRTPFSKISPKKTWEGTLGGVLSATLLIGFLIDRCVPDESLSSLAGYLLTFLLAVAGTAGDLFESKLKRMAGVKDSGKLMPGHGGVLDRFDSFLFALPVLYLFFLVLSLIVDGSLSC
jgi:phosphatidate cytidylyltransferase